MQTTVGQPNAVAMVFFFVFIAITLGITYWAAKRTKTATHYYAAGNAITGTQNGLAIAGDILSAATLLGISSLIYGKGYDGFLYCLALLVGFPVILFLMAERLRNLGKFTFADVAAFRFEQTPLRVFAASGTLVASMTPCSLRRV